MSEVGPRKWVDSIHFSTRINQALGDCPTHPVRNQDKLRAVLRELAEFAYAKGAEDVLKRVV